ncbi:MAG TPA: tetratricopeptide repeat protein [Kofleriaceae bacterium]|nr:tetratricopeptide repeat protein [Kofleriaceae bacterium]
MKLKELEKRLKHEPNNLGLRVTVAGMMHEAGRTAEAVELYRSVAQAYRELGRLQQALAVCKSVLELAPGDPACLALIAILTEPPPPIEPELDEHAIATAVASSPATGPARRSSFDVTPLPKPVPHHVQDPTSQEQRVSDSVLNDVDLPAAEGATTRPGAEERPPAVAGLAQAARRISGLISGNDHVDLAAELDTRQRKRIPPAELRKITQPPPTVPIERVDPDDAETPAARDTDEELTKPRPKDDEP